VAGFCVYGDEPSGLGSTVLVSSLVVYGPPIGNNRILVLCIVTQNFKLHKIK
jgi:hypothetical protein